MLSELEQKIEYTFINKELLRLALRHPSLGAQNNQRLEFLGDAVLQLLTSDRLYHQHPDMKEGMLSRTRARCVQEGALEIAARKLELGRYLSMGNGEESTGGREKPSVLADAMEALLGAMYLDGAIEQARKLIERIVPIIDIPKVHDFKTEYQEFAVQVTGIAPIYRILSEQGPPHDRTYRAQVLLGDNVMGEGEGTSKKTAQQQAARAALKAQGIGQ